RPGSEEEDKLGNREDLEQHAESVPVAEDRERAGHGIAGTSTVMLVPSALTSDSATTQPRGRPPTPGVVNTMGVSQVKPRPRMVMVGFGWAEGRAGSGGVPTAATATTASTANPSMGALVPPALLEEIGPIGIPSCKNGIEKDGPSPRSLE